MTFVTNVPCAHVIQNKKRLFLLSDIFSSRARKGQRRQNYEAGSVAKAPHMASREKRPFSMAYSFRSAATAIFTLSSDPMSAVVYS